MPKLDYATPISKVVQRPTRAQRAVGFLGAIAYGIFSLPFLVGVVYFLGSSPPSTIDLPAFAITSAIAGFSAWRAIAAFRQLIGFVERPSPRIWGS